MQENNLQADFSATMKKIEASNAGQERYAKKQYRMSQISAAANILVLAIVVYLTVILVPKVNSVFNDLNVILNNLDTITTELAAIDIDQMMNNVDGLVTQSSRDLKTAMEKVNSIDIDTLNSAIQNLNDTIKPLADFFHILG